MINDMAYECGSETKLIIIWNETEAYNLSQVSSKIDPDVRMLINRGLRIQFLNRFDPFCLKVLKCAANTQRPPWSQKHDNDNHTAICKL